MVTFHELAAQWSGSWWPLVANHLWQATFFALLAMFASYILKKGPAKVRHGVWLIALLKFALPSVFILALARYIGMDFSSLFAHKQPVSSVAPAITFISEPVSQTSLNTAASAISWTTEILIALTLVWLAGCATLLTSWYRKRLALSRGINTG